MKMTKHLSASATVAIICLSMFVVLAPKAKAATAPVVASSSVNESSSSMTLPGGADIYLYGYGTGGGAPSGSFNYGQYTSLTNQGGYVVAALAITTSNNNYFSTGSGYPVIGGVGVQGFSSYSSSFGTNNSPAAPSASDSFTVNTSGSLVVVIAIGGDEQSLTVSGLPNLQSDASWPGSPWNALQILHAYLDAGSYTITEYTSQSAAGQTPSYAGDLIGVFIFTPSGQVTPPGQVLPPSNVPSGILNWVAITLTNTQASTTPSPFQQIIPIDSTQYSQYEASNLQNILFFDSSGTLLPSWLESGNSNSATTTTYWLSILNGIPAASTITVYMGFASASTNFFNTQTTGEAPQLSPTYGGRDNGARVFTNYWNFAGTSLPNDWSISNLGSGATLIFNNGVFYQSPGYANGGTGINTLANCLNPENQVADALVQSSFQGNYGGSYHEGAYSFGCVNAGASTLDGDYAVWTGPWSYEALSPATPLNTNWNVLSVWASATEGYVSLNYNVASMGSGNGFSASTSSQVGWGGTGVDLQTTQLQWARVRAQPPNGVMPSVSISSVSHARAQSSTSVTCSPNSVSVGSSVRPVTCTAIVSGSNPTGNVAWSTTSATGSFSSYTCNLLAGSCLTTYIDTSTGIATITAAYAGDSSNLPSSNTCVLGSAINPSADNPFGQLALANGIAQPNLWGLVGGSSTGTVQQCYDSNGLSTWIQLSGMTTSYKGVPWVPPAGYSEAAYGSNLNDASFGKGSLPNLPFPMLVSSLNNINLWGTATYSLGTPSPSDMPYVFFYDLWLKKNPSSSGPQLGDLEVGITLAHAGGIGTNPYPIGVLVGHLSDQIYINDREQSATWDIYLGIGGTLAQPFYEFSLATPTQQNGMTISIRFQDFIDALSLSPLTLGKDLSTYSLMGVELGTEFAGSAWTSLNHQVTWSWTISSFYLTSSTNNFLTIVSSAQAPSPTPIPTPTVAPTSTFLPLLSLFLFSSANLFVTDPEGRSTGYDPSTGLVVNAIPSALYSGPSTEPQFLVIPNPLNGSYSIIMVGKANGNYTLTVEYATSTQTTTQTFNGTVSPQQTNYYSVLLSQTGHMTAISWEYVFQDIKRGTMLKISTGDKYFQFTAPGTDFGVKYDPKMMVLRNVIGIYYDDSTMRLIAAALVDRNNFCSAVAWDKQTNKVYLLIEIPQKLAHCRLIEDPVE
jgi:hypothetical protein